ncbi:Transposase [Suttonella ornithocola]|uniref:Transposase n=2 Tax=Suttonella ornithocola TaxID=279832 RepID=A0A380MNM5_9GAMM|nr:Transposase [Suttonella ornithocola]
MASVEYYPDAYQHEHAQRFHCSQTAIHKALKKLGISYKKTLRHPKANQDDRERFNESIAKYQKEETPIVYLDESSFRSQWLHRYGWSEIFTKPLKNREISIF